MTILGGDTSNHNHPNGVAINWAQVAASGWRFAVVKATEGIGFRDGWLDRDRSGAHGAGLLVGLYHFARSGDPAAQARYFLSAIGGLQPGEFVVLDDEDSAITPAWVKTWCETVHAATGVWPLVYVNQSTRDTGDWSGVVGDGDGLWLAKYDGSLAQPPSGAWPMTAMKQYSDAGSAAGIVGGVDLDVFYGSDAQLAAYGLHSNPAPAAPQGDIEMRIVQSPNRGAAIVGSGYFKPIPATHMYMAEVLWGTHVPCSDEQYDQAQYLSTQGSSAVWNTGIFRPTPEHKDPSDPAAWVSALQDAANGTTAATQAVALLDAMQNPAQIDEAKLAAALAPLLLADPKNVDALGAAIAAHLQLAPRVDAPTPPAA